MSEKSMTASQSPKERTPSQQKNDRKSANIKKQGAFPKSDQEKPKPPKSQDDALMHYRACIVAPDGVTIYQSRASIPHKVCMENGFCSFTSTSLVKYSLKDENISKPSSHEGFEL